MLSPTDHLSLPLTHCSIPPYSSSVFLIKNSNPANEYLHGIASLHSTKWSDCTKPLVLLVITVQIDPEWITTPNGINLHSVRKMQRTGYFPFYFYPNSLSGILLGIIILNRTKMGKHTSWHVSSVMALFRSIPNGLREQSPFEPQSYFRNLHPTSSSTNPCTVSLSQFAGTRPLIFT